MSGYKYSQRYRANDIAHLFVVPEGANVQWLVAEECRGCVPLSEESANNCKHGYMWGVIPDEPGNYEF